MEFLPTEQNQIESLKNARKIIERTGLTITGYNGCSDSFGMSFYFKVAETDKKIRVSDHSVTSKSRMENEILMSFDQRTMGKKGLGQKINHSWNNFLASQIS